MLSIPDMAVLGVLALLVFGEERLPGIVRQAGRIMRDVQNTSHSFVREMERAADIHEPVTPPPAVDLSDITTNAAPTGSDDASNHAEAP